MAEEGFEPSYFMILALSYGAHYMLILFCKTSIGLNLSCLESPMELPLDSTFHHYRTIWWMSSTSDGLALWQNTPPLARWRLSWWLNVFVGESQEPVWGSGCSMPLRPQSQVQNCPLQWSLLFELGQVTSSQPHYPTGWLWWGKRRKKSYLLLWALWRRGGI